MTRWRIQKLCIPNDGFPCGPHLAVEHHGELAAVAPALSDAAVDRVHHGLTVLRREDPDAHDSHAKSHQTHHTTPYHITSQARQQPSALKRDNNRPGWPHRLLSTSPSTRVFTSLPHTRIDRHIPLHHLQPLLTWPISAVARPSAHPRPAGPAPREKSSPPKGPRHSTSSAH
jgi:hypothetical protein